MENIVFELNILYIVDCVHFIVYYILYNILYNILYIIYYQIKAIKKIIFIKKNPKKKFNNK
jgi:hypothetical protein